MQEGQVSRGGVRERRKEEEVSKGFAVQFDSDDVDGARLVRGGLAGAERGEARDGLRGTGRLEDRFPASVRSMVGSGESQGKGEGGKRRGAG